jgi:ABC-2 type transport system ATP-binding protein
MSAAAAVTRTDDLAVEATAIRKQFGVGDQQVAALRGLDLQVQGGAITGVVGPDGSGKTTLLRLIAGLLLPDAGRLHVLGIDALHESEGIRGRVGYMPQRFGLYEDLSVAENLALFADLYGLPIVERTKRYAELMEFTGLGPFGARLAGKLSGGMKQKLGLACTLVHPPELLLLDEPSVGVDPISRRELWQIVRQLSGDGMTVVWSTAYQDEAERCDHVVVLYQGQRLADGRPADLIEPLRGRAFALSVPPNERRRVARRAKALPGVLDAVVQGRTVRILMAEGQPAPEPRTLLIDAAGSPTAFHSVSPRFEDAFVSLLQARRTREPHEDFRGEESALSPVEPTTPDGTDIDPSARPVIEIHDLTRDFGSFRAVDQMSFSVSRGEIFGLLGPNGAGKSTTFRMLCGLLPPSAGQAHVLGIDLRRSAPRARARIGYMSQKFALYGVLSVEQNLRFFASAYGLIGRQRDARVAWALETFDLGALAHRASDDLPLGFKQRLALGAALLHEPEILFLDEPTSGVDPLARREFWDRINALAESGVTILVTTHFLDEAEYCDRVGIIYQGRLIALGTPDELKDAARSEELPEPSLDDTFVNLITDYRAEHPE